MGIFFFYYFFNYLFCRVGYGVIIRMVKIQHRDYVSFHMDSVFHSGQVAGNKFIYFYYFLIIYFIIYFVFY